MDSSCLLQSIMTSNPYSVLWPLKVAGPTWSKPRLLCVTGYLFTCKLGTRPPGMKILSLTTLTFGELGLEHFKPWWEILELFTELWLPIIDQLSSMIQMLKYCLRHRSALAVICWVIIHCWRSVVKKIKSWAPIQTQFNHFCYICKLWLCCLTIYSVLTSTI